MTKCGERPNPETLRNTVLHVWIEKKPRKETAGMARGITKTSGRENSRKVSLALKIN